MNAQEAKDRLQQLLTDLQAQRDELRVQAHLGKAEAKEQWAALEAKLDELRAKAEAAKGPAGEVLDDVSKKAIELGEEIRHGFTRLKALF